jgi:DNA-binding LytR/AlgR family response regulator
MKKILSVDANLLYSKILKQDIEEYFTSIGETIEFHVSQTPQQTLDIINTHAIDIIFLDISSKQFDGIKLLKYIKQQPVRQSKIVGVMDLYDHTYRFQALKQKVYRYIYKPYDNKEIHAVLSKFFKINYYNKEINRTEKFINVDDIEQKESICATEVDRMEYEQELVETYISVHQKTDAKSFLKSYEDWAYDLEDLDNLELALDRLMMNLIMESDFETTMPDIINILETYNKFLYLFLEFDELSKVVYSIVLLLRNIDFDNIPSQTMVSKLLMTTIQDLVEWKEKVFVSETAEDIYYINDPILNSYVQLQDLLS